MLLALGPYRHYVWIHNRLVRADDFAPRKQGTACAIVRRECRTFYTVSLARSPQAKYHVPAGEDLDTLERQVRGVALLLVVTNIDSRSVFIQVAIMEGKDAYALYRNGVRRRS